MHFSGRRRVTATASPHPVNGRPPGGHPLGGLVIVRGLALGHHIGITRTILFNHIKMLPAQLSSAFVQQHAAQRRAVQFGAVSCPALRCGAEHRHAVQRGAVPCCSVPYSAMLYGAAPCGVLCCILNLSYMPSFIRRSVPDYTTPCLYVLHC